MTTPVDWYSVGLEKVAFLGSAVRGAKLLPKVFKNTTSAAGKGGQSAFGSAFRAATVPKSSLPKPPGNSSFWKKFKHTTSSRGKAFNQTLGSKATKGISSQGLKDLKSFRTTAAAGSALGAGAYLGNRAYNSQGQAAQRGPAFQPVYHPRPSQYAPYAPGAQTN